ncbi:MAG: hypothetical protein MPL62_09950 [Alphaproteobacteria bacterium]|nr:hypothetical protein [Alphaproteobacteria bacterium]
MIALVARLPAQTPTADEKHPAHAVASARAILGIVRGGPARGLWWWRWFIGADSDHANLTAAACAHANG